MGQGRQAPGEDRSCMRPMAELKRIQKGEMDLAAGTTRKGFRGLAGKGTGRPR